MCYTVRKQVERVEFEDNIIVNKLTILFFIDKMDVTMAESIIFEVCYYRNLWLEYMDCADTLKLLLDAGFLFKTTHDNTVYYNITPDGRACLSHFYSRIPASVRAEITEWVKENRASYRRKQEYLTSYHLNPDKTYTCTLKIVDSMKTALDLKFIVPNKEIAKSVAKKWELKAAQIYTTLYEQLVD